MNKYESVVIINPAVEEERLKELTTKFTDMINKDGKEIWITELEAEENKEDNALSIDEIEIKDIKKNNLEDILSVDEENEEECEE